MKEIVKHSWTAHTAAAVLIGIHFALAFSSARIKSPTIDEYTYIASGYYYVQTGDFRLDRTHPPLIRLLIGLPLQFLSINAPDPQMEKWDDPVSYELGYLLGKDMLLHRNNDIRTILLAARCPIMLLSCALAWLIYIWCSQMYGRAGGLAALFFYVLCPNMLAHCRLATLDLGSSFFLVLALYMLHRALQSPNRLRWILSGAALGAALAAKATAFLLIPIFLAAIVWKQAGGASSLRAISYGALCKQMGWIFASCILVLFLVYGFPFKPFYFIDTLNNVVGKSFASGKGGESIPGMPHRNYAFYLMGEYSTDGWPYYYLIAAAVKTPPALMLSLILYGIWGRRRWRGCSDGLILGAVVLLHVLAAFNRVNIGLRHILPFYPLLYLYMGRIVEFQKRRAGSLILMLLGIGYASSCALIHPDYLSYFNRLAGGPEKGHEYLDDSNIDWGQDLGRIAAVKDMHPNEPIFIAQEYIFSPYAFGFSAQPLQREQIASPPRGIVAVSKHWAIRNRIHPRSPYYFNWLEKYRPIGNIGHSIWLFRFGAGEDAES